MLIKFKMEQIESLYFESLSNSFAKYTKRGFQKQEYYRMKGITLQEHPLNEKLKPIFRKEIITWYLS